MINKNNLPNQTQFTIEDPILSGRPHLPEEEKKPVEPEVKVVDLVKNRRKIIVVGVICLAFLIIGVYLLLNVGGQQPATKTTVPEPTPTITPVPPDLSLREQIDVLSGKVSQFEKPSRNLVFPPVQTNIRIAEPK